MQTARSSRELVNSLAKGLEILSLFADGSLLGNQQLVELTGLPKATVSRITTTLTELGYLGVDPGTRKFLMGSRMVGMGASIQRKRGLQPIARPYMRELSTELDLTVSVATRDRLGMVVLEVMRPPGENLLVTNVEPGTVLPLPTTAIGLAYIAAAPVKERTKIIDGLRQRAGPEWASLRQALERAHREYSQLGFVLSQRSWGRDVNGVAVPMMLEPSKVLYSFHCAGPSVRAPLVRLRKYAGPKLRDMVERIRIEAATVESPRHQPPEIHRP